MDAFIRGVVDLIILSKLLKLDKDMNVDFGFCRIHLVHKSINYQYRRDF